METLSKDLTFEIGIHLSYPDVIQLALTSHKVVRNLQNFWNLLVKRRFPDISNSNLSDQQLYVFCESQSGVVRGSETFKTLNVCLNRALKHKAASLVKYFTLKGAKLTQNSVKPLFAYGDLNLIKQTFKEPTSRKKSDKSNVSLTTTDENSSLKLACSVSAKHNHQHLIDYVFETYVRGHDKIMNELDKFKDDKHFNPHQHFGYSVLIDYGTFQECVNSILVGAVKGRQLELFDKFKMYVNFDDILDELVFVAAKTNQVDFICKILGLTGFYIEKYLITEILRGAIQGNHVNLWKSVKNHKDRFNAFSYDEPDLNDVIPDFIISGTVKSCKMIYKLCELKSFKLEQMRTYWNLAIEHGRCNVIKTLLTTTYVKSLIDRSFDMVLSDLFGLHNSNNSPIKRNIWQVVDLLTELESKFKVKYKYNTKEMLKAGHKDFVLMQFKQGTLSVRGHITQEAVLTSHLDVLKDCVKILETEQS